MVVGLVQNIISQTDLYFLGQLGEIPLAANGIAYIWFAVFFMVGMGLAAGLQIQVARRYGEGDIPALGRTVNHGLLVFTLGGLVFWGALALSSQPIFRTMFHSEAMQAAALEYILPRAPELLFAFLFLGLRGFYTGIGRTQVLIWTGLLQAGVNVPLDYALIGGHWGLPELGVAGAGWASFIAQVVTFCAMLAHLLLYRYASQYRLFRFRQLSWSPVQRLLRLAWPLMLQYLMSLVSFIVFLDVVESFGERPAAITSLVYRWYIVLMVPLWGFQAAISTLVSQLLGASQPNRVARAIRRVTLHSFALTAGLAGLFFASHRWLYAQFTTSPEVAAGAAETTPVILLALLIMSVSVMLMGGVTGTGATRIAFLADGLSIVAYLVAVYGIAAYTQHLPIIWLAELTYVSTFGVVSLIYLLSGRWRGLQV